MAYRELLFKWNDIYRLEARKKCLQFVIEQPDSSDPLRPAVWGDTDLLEILLYNIIGNAVKYSYRGTKLHVDCSKMDQRRDSPHLLRVIDYGYEIEEGLRPYKLFYRGSEVGDEGGSGIGLYIAKLCADAHGSILKHSVSKVSEFNVPLISAFLSSDLANSDKELRESLKAELDRLNSNTSIVSVSDIVAMDADGAPRYHRPSTFELLLCIKRPTWQVTFELMIEARKDNEK